MAHEPTAEFPADLGEGGAAHDGLAPGDPFRRDGNHEAGVKMLAKALNRPLERSYTLTMPRVFEYVSRAFAGL